jgi:hypothetical protein
MKAAISMPVAIVLLFLSVFGLTRHLKVRVRLKQEQPQNARRLSSTIVHFLGLNSPEGTHGISEGLPFYISVWAVNQFLQAEKYKSLSGLNALGQLQGVGFEKRSLELGRLPWSANSLNDAYRKGPQRKHPQHETYVPLMAGCRRHSSFRTAKADAPCGHPYHHECLW